MEEMVLRTIEEEEAEEEAEGTKEGDLVVVLFQELLLQNKESPTWDPPKEGRQHPPVQEVIFLWK